MTIALTEDETGKTVVDREGTRLGTVSEVTHGRAQVSADERTVEKMQAELGSGGTESETYALDDESIAEITDDEVVLEAEY